MPSIFSSWLSWDNFTPALRKIGGFSIWDTMRHGIGRLRCGGDHPSLTTVSAIVAYYQGSWYDPSDISTLFQDTAGTTPVAADGDPVGLMKDKGPLLVNVTQATGGSRPTYHNTAGKFSIEGDGIDDVIQTATASYGTMPGYHYMAAAVQRTALSNLSLVSVQQSGALFHRLMNNSASNRFTFRVQDGGTATANSAINSVPIGTSVVSDSQWSFTGGDLEVNAGAPVSGTGSLGVSLGPNSVVFGNAAQDFKFYGVVLLRAIPSGAERAIIQAFLATKI